MCRFRRLGALLLPVLTADGHVLQAVRPARYLDHRAVVAQPVGDRRGRDVAAEHVAPPADRHVGRDDRRPLERVAPVHQLEQQVGALLPDIEVAQLVYYQQAAVLVEPHPARQRLLRRGVLEVLDQPRAVGEVHLLAGHHRLVAYGYRQVGLADARAADEHDVVAAVDELERGQLLDQPAGHARLETPVEVGQRLYVGEVGHPRAALVVGAPLEGYLGVGELEHGVDQALPPVGDEPDVIGHRRRHALEPQLLEIGRQAVERAGLHRGAHSEPPIESSSPRLAAAAASMSPAASPNQRFPAMASA